MANRVSYLIVAKDAFSKVGKKVINTTKVMKKNFKGLSDTMDFTGGKLKELALAAGAFFGVQKFFGEGMKFQDQLTDLAAISGATGKDLQFLSDESLRLAGVSKLAASETATAFKLVASAKAELLRDPKALSKVTEQTLLLSNASGVALADSATIVTEALNQFGASADEANRFVNVLAAGSKFGASEVAQTGAAIVKSAVVARSAGVSFEQLNGAIQVLAQNGIKAEEAGTALKTALLSLEIKGPRNLKPSVVGLDKALENLGKRNLSTAQLNKLFGAEAINVGKILIRESAAVKKMTSDITGTSTAADQAAIRLGSFSAKLRGLGVKINDKLIKVFLKLEKDKVFTKLVNDFGKFIEKIDSSDLDSAIQTIKVLADAIMGIGKALKIILLLFKGVGIAIGELAGQIATGNFSSDIATSMADAFSFDEIKATLGFENVKNGAAGVTASKADVNINLNAPPGVVSDVKSEAKSPLLKVGVNMQGAPA